MPVQLPNFITIEYLHGILLKNLPESGNLKVKNFWGEWATKQGDNYASEMYRIHIDCELDNKSFTKRVLLKLTPSGEIVQMVMENNRIYPREIQAYSELLFEAEKLLESIGDFTKFAPSCLHTSFEPKNHLIFDDMREQGYRPFPRNHQLTFDQCLPIIEKLAKLHAVSVVLVEKNPSIMELFEEGSISTNPVRKDFLVHYKNFSRALGTVVAKEWSEEWKEMGEKILKFSHKIIQAGCDLYLRDETTFNVFNHNDLWIPNILFKFNDDDSIQDVLFIDFQLSYYGSPGIDLNFFLYGSLDEEARIEGKAKIIRKYHEVLSRTLQKMDYSKTIPSLHDVHVILLKSGMNGVLAAIAEVPLLLVEQSDNLKMDLLLASSDEAEEFRVSLFRNPRYKKFVEKLLLEFDGLGYFD